MSRATDIFMPNSRDVYGRLRTRRVAEQHFDAEITNNIDEILQSMKTYNPLFTSTILDPTGNKIFRCNTVDEQREFYRARREHSNMIKFDVRPSAGGDWYGFVQAISHNQAIATGEVFESEVVGLLPITPDEDTIAGEIGMSMPPYGYQGDVPGALPRQRVALAELLTRWIDALRKSDA